MPHHILTKRRNWLTRCSAGFFVLIAVTACGVFSPKLYTAEDLKSASTYQQEMLADGKITGEEYRKAISADRDCVALAGYDTSELVTKGRLLAFTTEADYANEPDPEAADEAFLKLVNDCSLEYSKYVGYFWTEKQAVPQAK